MRKILLFFIIFFIIYGCTERYKSNELFSFPRKDNKIHLQTLLQTKTIAKPSDEENKTFIVIDAEIIKFILDNQNVLLADNNYYLPNKEFIINKILPVYDEFIIKNKLTYNDKFDCDDFSRAFCLYSTIVFNFEKTPADVEGIAVGEFWYRRQEDKKKHAINIIITNELEIIFIEPQTGLIMQLTNSEYNSAILVRF